MKKHTIFMGIGLLIIGAGLAIKHNQPELEAFAQAMFGPDLDVEGMGQGQILLTNTNMAPLDIYSAKLNGRDDCVLLVMDKLMASRNNEEPWPISAEQLVPKHIPGSSMGGNEMMPSVLPKITLHTGGVIQINLMYGIFGYPCLPSIVKLDVNTNQGTISYNWNPPMILGRDF